LLGLILLATILSGAGCGGFVAHRMVQAPNTYPTWLAPAARVELAFVPGLLTNFPARFAEVGPPSAHLHYRVVEPADFGLTLSSTNWLKRGKTHFCFSLRATVPGQTHARTSSVRGTVVLLHGYGLSDFAMLPWALALAQEGWRSVLVDLRGHGQSTGSRIYYGLRETSDLSQLLDELAREGGLAGPIGVVGESYGAALALRWKAMEPRLDKAVAIAPYAVLSNAVLNLCREYAPCLPRSCVRAGLSRLPSVLETDAAELDPATVLARSPVAALFIAGTGDQVIPVGEVQRLREAAADGSQLLIVPGATHEALPYYFTEIAPPVLAWLEASDVAKRASPGARLIE
jgi:pimeloyl-ACP methyl ester carboxylesterase